jgi:DNA-directed RNA polymerase subunit H (RpoH/RPB5)
LGKKGESLSHELAPEHKVLSEEAKKKVLEQFKANDAAFPRIHHNDPALAGLEAKPGDLIHIRRKDLDGENDYYRLVVKN